MKSAAFNVMVFGLVFAAAPCSAAIVVQATQADDATVVFTADNEGWKVTPLAEPVVDSDPVDAIGATLTNYAAMLPMPADWILLVTGFGVIGYAMRSRKRARVNFN